MSGIDPLTAAVKDHTEPSAEWHQSRPNLWVAFCERQEDGNEDVRIDSLSG